MNSPVKYQAWEAQKAAYMKATANWVDPLTEELIPHTFRTEEEGETIPAYVRLPVTASRQKPVPTMLLITGLDGYRPDNTQRSYEFVRHGWGVVIVEIPGTADSPADPKDPKSPDRLWDSVFKWMGEKGVFDMKSVVAWGLSCGGYYAVRIAHTHQKHLKGSVAQGAGVHHFFSEAWLRKADDHEYPFEYDSCLWKQTMGWVANEPLASTRRWHRNLATTPPRISSRARRRSFPWFQLASCRSLLVVCCSLT